MLQPAGCSFTFQLIFLYFINSPWKSAFNKKDREDIDDVTDSWDSQVCVQTKDCFGWKKLHKSPRNVSLEGFLLLILRGLEVQGSPVLYIP